MIGAWLAAVQLASDEACNLLFVNAKDHGSDFELNAKAKLMAVFLVVHNMCTQSLLHELFL
jgi:hypothetical protein